MIPTERIFLGLGSNLNHPQEQLKSAIRQLSGAWGITLIRQSAFYCSKPWGGVKQADFVNAVIEIEFDAQPLDLLDRLHMIENNMGRQKLRRWAERKIDLDILAFGSRVIDSTRLQIPHLHIAQRAFVWVPWLEIAPEFELPGQGELKQITQNFTKDPSLKLLSTQ